MLAKLSHLITNKYLLAALACIAIVIGVVSLFSPEAGTDQSDPTSTRPVVETLTAQAYNNQAPITLVGTVRAFSESAITAERAGRVTSVRAGLGDTVAAGQIIATLENASEQAAVLQAEGVYEAALAAAAQNGVSVTEAQNQLTAAQNNAVTTVQSAYGTVNNAVLTTIDQLFSAPDTPRPGLRIDGQGATIQLNTERVAYQTLLSDWQQTSQQLTATATNLDDALQTAIANTGRTIALLDTFITVFATQGTDSRYSDEELLSFTTQFTGARSGVVSMQSALQAAQTQLAAAREGVTRATLAASGGQTSAADAQIKQALGSLRAAQANLAQTIIRTPIAGTVNALSVRTGDFIGAQQQVAEVANNGALEIVTAISVQERDLFTVGDEVTLSDGTTGFITEIAPAVAAATGKIELRVAASTASLENGDTVTLARSRATSTVTDARVFVPLAAVKFQQTDGFVFVVRDDLLQAVPVTIGAIRGDAIEITSGLSPTDAFVSDARGLQAGVAVEVSN